MAGTTVTANENGPYLVPGCATYIDANGKEQKTTGSMFALCRCGQSGNKPFCDGAHKKAGFTAPKVELTVTAE
jgi:CDGSH-type Zn-finger protein